MHGLTEARSLPCALGDLPHQLLDRLAVVGEGPEPAEADCGVVKNGVPGSESRTGRIEIVGLDWHHACPDPALRQP